MRNELNLTLPGTAVIWLGGSLDSDSGGNYDETFTNGGTVSCRVKAESGFEREIGERLDEATDWTITLPALTSIAAEDRLVISGGTYSVSDVPERSYELSRRVSASKLSD